MNEPTAFVYDVEILSIRDTTLLAILQNKYGTPEDVWIPLSCITDFDAQDIQSGDIVDLEISRWVLEEKGII